MTCTALNTLPVIVACPAAHSDLARPSRSPLRLVAAPAAVPRPRHDPVLRPAADLRRHRHRSSPTARRSRIHGDERPGPRPWPPTPGDDASYEHGCRRSRSLRCADPLATRQSTPVSRTPLPLRSAAVDGVASRGRPAHRKRVGRTAGDDQVDVRIRLGWRIADLDDVDRCRFLQPPCDGAGDLLRVAEHRLVHHKRLHPQLPFSTPARASPGPLGRIRGAPREPGTRRQPR